MLIGLSAAVHVAVFAIAGGGSSRGDDLTNADTTALVEIPIDVQADPTAADAPAHAHPHHHHHDYPVSPDHDLVDHDPSIVHTPYAAHDHDHTSHDPLDADHDHDHDAPAAAPQTETAPAQGALPHFEMSIGPQASARGAVTSTGTGNVGGTGASSSHAEDEAPVAESTVSSRASLVSGGVPAYPAEAREADVEADVPLEIVVDATGNVKSARPIEHAGYGLEDAAITAVRRFRFAPAQRGGHPVAVRMRWVVAFRLK